MPITKRELRRIESRVAAVMDANPLMDSNAIIVRNKLITEDIPRLIEEVERLQSEKEESE